jgi:hypothetical protein
MHGKSAGRKPPAWSLGSIAMHDTWHDDTSANLIKDFLGVRLIRAIEREGAYENLGVLRGTACW